MKKPLMFFAALVAAASMLVLPVATAAPPAAAAPPTANAISIPINFTNTLGSFTGMFDVQRFVAQNGGVAAVGTLTGTVKDAAGTVLGTVNQPLTLPILQATGTCQILHLELGPLDLNLLGLVVHLDKVVLDITAQSGPGNLLGNLLCAVAHLLDQNQQSPTALQQIVNLLNQLLGAL